MWNARAGSRAVRAMTRHTRILALLLPALSACSAVQPTHKTVGGEVAAPTPIGATDVAGLAERVRASVVNITSVRSSGPFGDGNALGTGFVVDARGLIVTNAHVIEDASELRVRFADGADRDAKVKGRDAALDLAVLEVSVDKPLPAVTLGSSDALRVGEPVIAIGNPFGLDHTVTMGIVSAKGRAIGAGPYDDFLQTDASINPGNSGGPLFDARGRVVGINTAINPAGQGIGFAIPVDVLKDVLPQLVEKGRVTRGRLGVAIQSLDATLAKALGLDSPKGALVTSLEPDGPAARAGIKTGDVILRVDDRDVTSGADLPRLVAHHAPGTVVPLRVRHGKSVETLRATLDARADADPAPKPAPSTFKGRLGVALDDAEGTGARIVAVASQSPAARAHLRAGDVIVELDGKTIANAASLIAAIESIPAGKAVVAKVVRGPATRFAGVELG